ncbi:MAG: C4-dicarboxylate transporter DctA [Sphingobacteriia bacterium]|nr:MAG: C4-dicarboxylate transporter DctA [Sphingobacteriia bacterium]TAG31044.1 MAG: C4-dicarboxylate transporter DctA [Sphingobacteriia bacterium]TAH08344.1 MAG: C4-dicarboxylate transporter DctA [Sphingobacteriia bacterium]
MKYFKLLYIQVVIAILLGIATGCLFPSFAPVGKLISEKFIDLIKTLIIPILFFTIVLGIAGAGDLKKVGRVGGKGLLYFEVVTTLALFIGIMAAYFIKPGLGVDISGLHSSEKIVGIAETGKKLNWVDFFTHIIPNNIFKSLADGDILPILLFSVLFGIGITKIGPAANGLISGLDRANKVIFQMMKMIMLLAPLGAFGGMAYTIGTYGATVLLSLGKLMGCFYITVFLFIAIVLNLIAKYNGFSLWKLLVYIKAEIFIVIGSSSSESVLPNIMQKLEQAGCSKTVVGLIIPTGYSFNLDGTTIYLSMATIFLAQVFGVQLDLWQQVSLMGILMVTSKGAAGVTGSGFIVLASTLSALKIIPLEGLALLLGVDRFMSEARSVTNLIGNTVAAVVIAKSEHAVDEELYRSVVENK